MPPLQVCVEGSIEMDRVVLPPKMGKRSLRENAFPVSGDLLEILTHACCIDPI